MKIVIDARFYGVENTGIGRYVVNLVSNLTRLDKENEYIILLRKKYFDTLDFPENWQKVLVEAKHYSFREQVEIPKVMRAMKPDVIHFPHFNIPLFWRGNFVVTIHDILMHKQKGKDATTLPALSYKIKRVGYRSVFDCAVKRSKKIIVPTNFVKEELLRNYKIDKEKIVVTHEGVDDISDSNISKETVFKKYSLEDKYFIYTGNAYPHKNLSRAIEAVGLLNAGFGERIVFYIVCARSVFVERLEKEIERQKAREFVKLLGFIPDSELAVMYKHSLGFLYPSLYEGFGLPGLEAMKQGTLALVSDIPVFREVYKDKAFYFNPYDFTSIKKTMQEAIEMNKIKRIEMIKRGRNFLTRYSWAKMAKQTLEVYNEALK